MVSGIRSIELAIGDGMKNPKPTELSTAEVARRSLTAAVNVPAGGIFTRDKIEILRPGTGIPPATLPYILGRKAKIDIPEGTVLSLEMFE